MVLENKVESLFNCMPFDEIGIINFKDFIKKNTLEKRFFYKKNSQGQTFIQTLLNMGVPKNIEEQHVRVHLLYNFYIDSFTSSLVSKDILNNLREEYVKNIYHEYENYFDKEKIVPKFTLNEYFKQINDVIKESGTENNAKNNINDILTNYFDEFKVPASIAQSALLIKVFDSIYVANSKEQNTKNNAEDIGYKFRNFTEDFLRAAYNSKNIISNCLPKLIRQLVNIKEFREIGVLKLSNPNHLLSNIWSDQIALKTLENVVAKYLMNNKVKADYEALSVELGHEKKSVLRLKFMPKSENKEQKETEKNKRTKL